MQTGDADVIAPKSSQNPSTSAATSDGTAADDRMRMFCKTCIKYEKVGSFVVGSTVFKLESIKAHNVSSGHVNHTPDGLRTRKPNGLSSPQFPL